MPLGQELLDACNIYLYLVKVTRPLSSLLRLLLTSQCPFPRCFCCSVTQSCLILLWPRGLLLSRLSCLSSIFWSVLKLTSIKLMTPFNHLKLCCPLLPLPSVFPRISVFSSELALRIRCQNYSASASVLPMNILGRFPLGLTGLISLVSTGLSDNMT